MADSCAISTFLKNKLVEDWSLLGMLPELEGMHFFRNQRITSLWDMRGNTALKALVIEDFTRLHDLPGLEMARHLSGSPSATRCGAPQ